MTAARRRQMELHSVDHLSTRHLPVLGFIAGQANNLDLKALTKTTVIAVDP
jgi:hypothetical protein